MFGYNAELRSATDYFKRAFVLGTDNETEALKIGTHNGALTVEVNAGAVDLVLESADSVSFSLLECDTEHGTFTEAKGKPALSVAGAVTYKAGEKIATMVLPNAKKFVKVKVNKTGTATGEIDIWQGYMAR